MISEREGVEQIRCTYLQANNQRNGCKAAVSLSTLTTAAHAPLTTLMFFSTGSTRAGPSDSALALSGSSSAWKSSAAIEYDRGRRGGMSGPSESSSARRDSFESRPLSESGGEGYSFVRETSS
jgi:hypothetical protein